MDGEHFSFLVLDGKITHRSPVVITSPCCTDVTMASNVVLAKNFTHFLRLGLHHGFSSLVELGFNPKVSLPLYLSDCASTESAAVLGDALDKQRYKMLDFVAEMLDLHPYTYTTAEFVVLQQRYMPLLTMPADYDDPNICV